MWRRGLCESAARLSFYHRLVFGRFRLGLTDVVGLQRLFRAAVEDSPVHRRAKAVVATVAVPQELLLQLLGQDDAAVLHYRYP